ncbi:MAG: hypothetical protein OER96_10135 [Gammaproteobacteria bacterium]|nr:hypothetical protein [Gammaproteobacteria bacterium]
MNILNLKRGLQHLCASFTGSRRKQQKIAKTANDTRSKQAEKRPDKEVKKRKSKREKIDPMIGTRL